MVFSLLSRIYYGFIRPPPAHKQDDAIRFGLIGASQIAPIALIAPAKSHPEVIVAAVAARDRDRAASYAKKHDIPIVHASYQALLNDPSIDAVYISLPNSHHYEWALRALKAGKHVLLEKPSTANAAQASALFTHPLATAPNAPVLLEAFHYVFHPAWQTFLALLRDPSAGRIESAFAAQYMPAGLVAPAGDIRWRYDLAGGAMMDFGTYPLHALRQMPGQEPVKGSLGAEARLLDRAKYRGFEREETEVDEYMRAWFRGDGGAEARMEADLSVTGGWPFLPASWTRGVAGDGVAEV
ncbi:hypothetical protein N7468_000268 [Penicillium chermesinum]|uniref:D-xylose 1-dehydrogenase (NADP(+), D-xylono-1,5-lactone-forming) n=1 Tax=Penicillium chermesinum TaxID=63820 RepID=A0A9W9PJZ0_9EURO|nr:uncharacterized protein N7468_000268 [Penicillium chermesinum]KAJ5248817.1 hypothetical protein N7468_000268 [Penicillium chermesinum]